MNFIYRVNAAPDRIKCRFWTLWSCGDGILKWIIYSGADKAWEEDSKTLKKMGDWAKRSIRSIAL